MCEWLDQWLFIILDARCISPSLLLYPTRKRRIEMPERIQTSQIQSYQQIEAVVAGPDGANRLFTVTGQFDIGLQADPQILILGGKPSSAIEAPG